MIEIKEISKEQTWEVRHVVMWPNKEFDFIKIEGDDDAIHFGLYDENELISVISLFIDKQEAQFRKFATLSDKQEKGYGTKLLNFVIHYCHKNNIQRLWCNARLNKKVFYEKFGLIKTDVRFTKENKEYIIMETILK